MLASSLVNTPSEAKSYSSCVIFLLLSFLSKLYFWSSSLSISLDCLGVKPPSLKGNLSVAPTLKPFVFSEPKGSLSFFVKNSAPMPPLSLLNFFVIFKLAPFLDASWSLKDCFCFPTSPTTSKPRIFLPTFNWADSLFFPVSVSSLAISGLTTVPFFGNSNLLVY